MAEMVPLQEWPAPVEITETTVTFDLTGAVALELFREASEGNLIIGENLSGQVVELKAEAEALIDAGRAQRRVADLRKEILEEERRHHMWEKLGLYLGMVLLAVGVAL